MGVFHNRGTQRENRQTKERDQRGEETTKKKEKSIRGNGIFNLSSKPLTDGEKAILDKGLIPPENLTHFKLLLMCKNTSVKLTLKRYIASNPIKEGRNFFHQDTIL